MLVLMTGTLAGRQAQPCFQVPSLSPHGHWLPERLLPWGLGSPRSLTEWAAGRALAPPQKTSAERPQSEDQRRGKGSSLFFLT